MINVKSTILKFITKYGYGTLTSIRCARIIINNVNVFSTKVSRNEVFDLKVNYTEEELNNFLQELDFDMEMNIETIRGNLWMNDDNVAELDYYDDLDFAEWRIIRIPSIPSDLIF